MTDTRPLFVSEFRAPQPHGDTIQKFQQILTDYREGWLTVPVHQRDADAWSARKKKEYINRLKKARDGSNPPGSFATYQLVGLDRDASPIYLNDGLQRLTTLTDLQADPGLYDTDSEGVRDLLQQTITVHHRHYDTHDEAMTDFQLINNGTRLTPYELCRGFLQYMDGYKERWESLFDDIYEVIRESEARLRMSGRRTGQEREQEHKRRRHTLSLFHRFLIGEKRPVPYLDVYANEIQQYVDNKQIIELRLRAELQTRGYDEARRVQKVFGSFIQAETAQLETSIQDTLGNGAGLAPVTHRWLLDLAVWRRHNNVPREQHQAFVTRLLENTRGGAQWNRDDNDGKRNTVTLSLSHLGHLPKLAEFADMPDFCVGQRRRRGANLRPGYDNSHYMPFATDGDGPTFPEPAPANRSRGARPAGEIR